MTPRGEAALLLLPGTSLLRLLGRKGGVPLLLTPVATEVLEMLVDADVAEVKDSVLAVGVKTMLNQGLSYTSL